MTSSRTDIAVKTTFPSDPLAVIQQKTALQKSRINRLARHLVAGELGKRGHYLIGRVLRIEFWAYNFEARSMRVLPKLKIRVHGWTPREAHFLIKNALEADRVRQVKLRRKMLKGQRVVAEQEKPNAE